MAQTAVPVVIDAGAAPPAAEAPLTLEHPHTSTGLDNRKLLMWAFLASDCMFFGTLIATYMVYKNRSLVPPYPREVFDVPYTSVSAFVLLLSSLTMVLALAAIQRGEERRMRIWLGATALLGCVFLGGQFYEFTTFYHEGLTLSSNLFGSTFFTLTGFHGTHVFIGVFWLSSLVVHSFRGKLHQEHSLLVEIGGLYWHFVDIVWILIFTLVYLIPD
ncbi:MAG TPA: heme-copper oxidase subunit III [Chloroflexota bacterium]|jgi:heme/copper-type cytochrome/quinol oxidase subunit 3